MAGDSGSLSPISTSSTAVDQPSIDRPLYRNPSPQKSLDSNDDTGGSTTLPLPRRRRNSLQRRSFSSADKLPILEPSTSPVRRRFDFLLLWILQNLTAWYLTLVAWKRYMIYACWGLWYDWHAWPRCGRTMIERDIAGFDKLPRHVAVVLGEKRPAREYDADEMVRRVVDVATWCACAGILTVTVYEATGLLKKDTNKIERNISKRIAKLLQRSIPYDVRTPQSALMTNGTTAENRGSLYTQTIFDVEGMEILILSQEDSRLPIIDLARTLGDMTKQEKLFAEEISIDLVHANLTEMLMTEPDLLILFSPRVDFQGFPPWQIRLTEIFHLPDNSNFGYSVFIRALQAYNRAEMRLGR